MIADDEKSGNHTKVVVRSFMTIAIFQVAYKSCDFEYREAAL
jgi:hypothetical protein